MTLFFFMVGNFFLLHGFYQLIKYFIIASEIKKKYLVTEKTSPPSYHNIIVFVPVLHEETTIERFIEDISNQTYPSENFQTYIITTEKENLVNKNKGSSNTIDIVNQILLQKKYRYRHFHYPNSDGHKTDQLDFAFQKICSEIGRDKVVDTFFLFLDADSEVDSGLIERFNHSIEDKIELYQQPLLWFKNISTLQNKLMKSFSFLQSFFSISYEIPMFVGKFFPWRLKYLVGNGLFIRGSYLLKVRGFPPLIEDVRLGRLSSFLQTEIKLVPGFGNVETAKDFLTYIKQSSVWFFGCGLFVSDYIFAKSLKDATKITAKDAVRIGYGFFKAFRWMNKGLLHLLGLVFSIIHANQALLLLFTISLIMNSSIPVLVVAFNFRKKWGERISVLKKIEILLEGVIFSPAFYVLNFLGPYYGLFKLFKYYLCGTVTLPKTIR